MHVSLAADSEIGFRAFSITSKSQLATLASVCSFYDTLFSLPPPRLLLSIAYLNNNNHVVEASRWIEPWVDHEQEVEA
jgi:hypothetical protein